MKAPIIIALLVLLGGCTISDLNLAELARQCGGYDQIRDVYHRPMHGTTIALCKDGTWTDAVRL